MTEISEHAKAAADKVRLMHQRCTGGHGGPFWAGDNSFYCDLAADIINTAIDAATAELEATIAPLTGARVMAEQDAREVAIDRSRIQREMDAIREERDSLKARVQELQLKLSCSVSNAEHNYGIYLQCDQERDQLRAKVECSQQIVSALEGFLGDGDIEREIKDAREAIAAYKATKQLC